MNRLLEELANEYNAEIRGWYGYYGRFYPLEMRKIWEHINWYLVQWVRRKYKKLAKSSIRARGYLKRIASQNRDLFIHWRLGVLPEAEMVEAV
ncbi:group II intron maturase-specific domain-containing protein [Candidatus Amoebophilus asiaticus]|uniref:group II intron maturase-specific domain-containing protein n=1 Tax=Candidatus Amoebophilus asiaticus TaxID=281120 RepID=UPI0009FEE6CB|nr:group II intron maturase-specific domain-containing protein [Candidatus Amoebophilus asiaticus]